MSTVPIYPINGPYHPASGTILKPTMVLGAGGELGRAIVGALLAQGRPVIAVDADPEALGSLQSPTDDVPELVRVVGHTGTETAGAALANAVRLLRRPPGAVVALIGGSYLPGRLLDHPVERLRRKLDEDLFPHLVAARHLVPLLAESGTPANYLLLGGPAADSPWAGYGHLSVSQAALRMLARSLREETAGTPVRVQQLSVCQPVRTADKCDCAGVDWPLPVEIGLQVAELVANAGTEPVVRFDRRRRG